MSVESNCVSALHVEMVRVPPEPGSSEVGSYRSSTVTASVSATTMVFFWSPAS